MTDEIKGSCLRLCKPVADEIERLQAEIERLGNKVFVLENDLDKAESLNEALENDVDIKLNHIYDLEEKLTKAKAEAIKEFAERLKTETFLAKAKGSVEHVLWIDEIDNLVKEMTEPVKVDHNSLCETETYKGE